MNKALQKTVDRFVAVFHPGFLFGSRMQSKEWDEALHRILDKVERGDCKAVICNEHLIEFQFSQPVQDRGFKNIHVWAANYPYSSGDIYKVNGRWGDKPVDTVPGRLARVRLNRLFKKLQEQARKEQINQLIDRLPK